MTPTEQQSLITLAINETPALISALKVLFGRHNPGTPAPTSEEVIAAYQTALTSSLLTDEQWLAAHPTFEDSETKTSL